MEYQQLGDLDTVSKDSVGCNQNTMTDKNKSKQPSLVLLLFPAKNLSMELGSDTGFTKGKLKNCEVLTEPLPLP